MFYELDPCSFFLSLYFESGTLQNMVKPLEVARARLNREFKKTRRTDDGGGDSDYGESVT